jgi:hypothetical protein
VFEDEGSGLFPMAGAALLVESGHAEAAGGLEDLAAVGVVALDAVHLPFEHRVVLGQSELHLDILVAVVTCLWIFAGVENQPRPITWCGGVKASGAVATFAAGAAGKFLDIGPDPEVDITLEGAGVIGVTVVTLVIPDKGCSRDLRGNHQVAGDGRAGAQESDASGCHGQQGATDRRTFPKCECHRFQIISQL